MAQPISNNAPTTTINTQTLPGNVKTMDLVVGNISLSGIPADFNSITQTTGASGGTDTISGILDQLAVEMEQNGQTTQSQEIKKLAELGHNIAKLQNYFEKAIVDCQGDQSCITKAGNVQMSQGFWDETNFNFVENIPLRELLSHTKLGERHLTNPAAAKNYVNTDNGNMSYIFYNQVQKVMNDPSFDQQTKNVVQELSWDIASIAEEFKNNVDFMTGSSNRATCDFITQECSGIKNPGITVEDFASYKSSTITNFDSALICAAGKHTDSGASCH